MSDFSNYNFAPNDPCIIEGRLVQLWRPRVFVELHYITLHYITLFISTKIFTLGLFPQKSLHLGVYLFPQKSLHLGVYQKVIVPKQPKSPPANMAICRLTAADSLQQEATETIHT